VKENRGGCRAAIFDLDGTLLDTLDDIADSMNAALKRMGFPVHDTAAFRYLTGHGMRSMAERSLPAANRDEITVQACIREFRSEYENRWAAKTHPYQGIPELLDELTGRGIKLGILSNKLDKFTNLVARHFLSRWEFSSVVGARPDLPQKPDPAGAVLIARELGIPPAQFVYLGDTGVDMRTAVQAGMFPVGALWGFRDEKELLEDGARAVIRSPCELLPFLD
jgi:phosphoglycolate phosphatase